MNTISRILGPSITLACWLVGSSLTSADRVRFSKSNRLFDNVWPSSGGILSFCSLDIDVLPLYMYNKGQCFFSVVLWGPPSPLLACLLAVLLPQIGSDFRNRTGCSTMYHQNVEVYSHSPSYILVILLCICIIKANGHYQQDSRALHHAVVSTWWPLSCLGLGLIFEIEPALSQCITKTWRYTATLLLIYW